MAMAGELFAAERYWANVLPLSIMGQWPYQSKKTICIRTTLWLLLIASILAPEICFSVSDPTLDTIVTGLPPQVAAFVAIVKVVNNIAYWGNVKKLLSLMEDEWKDLQPGPEYDIMMKYSNNGKLYTMAYFTMFWSFMSVYMLMPHFGEIMYAFGYRDSPGEFMYTNPVNYYFFDCYQHRILVEIHQVVCTISLVSTLVTFDSLFIVFVQHVCGEFARICYKLENIPIKRLSSVDVHVRNRTQDEAYKIISDCIKRHSRALEFAETIRETFSWSFFVSVTLSATIIAFSLMQMANHVDDKDVLIQYAPFTAGQISYFYIESAISQELLNHSGKVEHSVRLTSWYGFSLSSRKMLNLLSLRSRKLCKITAGAFFDLSVELFVIVMKTAFSYFTVLVSMSEE